VFATDNLSKSIALKIAERFHSLKINYDLIVKDKGQSLQQMAKQFAVAETAIARSIVLQHKEYYCLVVVPLGSVIDFTSLKYLSQRDLELVDLSKTNALFPDCDDACTPPTGDLYQLETYYDSSLLEATSIIFEAGSKHCVVRLYNEDFLKLMGGQQHAQIARPSSDLRLLALDDDYSGKGDLSFRFECIDDYEYQSLLPSSSANAKDLENESCPSQPSYAKDIVQLQMKKDFSFRELREILESKPKLYDTLVTTIGSTLFSGFVNLNDSDPEKTRISGPMYTLVLGLVILHEFKVNTSSILNTEVIYQHALMSTAFSLRLAAELKESGVISNSILILGGLLQNIGLLYYGQQHPDRYFLLSRLIETNPEQDLTKLEARLNQGQGLASLNEEENKSQSNLAYHHPVIGAALVSDWQMPEEVVHTVRFHHDLEYKLEHFQYPNLLLVANCLLVKERDETSESCRLSKSLFERLRIRPELCMHSAVRFYNECAKISPELCTYERFEVVF